MFQKKRLFLFWKIGKNVFEGQDLLENAVLKYSTLCTYRYGMSETFSTINVYYMEKFYLAFPIYRDDLNKLSFEHYKLLVDISEMKRRYFYFRLSIFCRSTVDELRFNIINNLYDVISEA